MKRATLFVLLLFTLSGVSGLTYEIVWVRMLSHLLGGTSYAISTVLAAFMGGLALGSRFFGPRADTTTRPLQLYAKLEFGIAVLCILVYALIRIAPPAYVVITGMLPEGVLGLFRVLIAGILLLPPTFLMGGTLPVLSRFVVRNRTYIGRGLGILYALNTLGAVLGSFLTAFVLIASLGIAGTTAIAIAINILVGAAAWLINRGVKPAMLAPPDVLKPTTDKSAPVTKKKTTAKDAKVVEAPEINHILLAVIFALSGFASLGYELYWTRALQYFLGNSTYAFSAMLTTFLLGLATGGWVGGRLADRLNSPARLLGWVQVLVGVTAMATVLLIWEWLPRVTSSHWLQKSDLSWNVFLFRQFFVAFAVMALPTFFTGMTFPIVNRIGIHRLDRLGQGVGLFYYANTIGAIIGSLTAGFVVLPLLGAKAALIATAVFSVAIGLTIHLNNRRGVKFEPIIAAVLFLLLFIAGPRMNDVGRAFLSDTQGVDDIVLFDAEDHAGETRVYRKPSGDMDMSVDGHFIGGTEPTIIRKEKILAHLPMTLRPEARRVLVIGLGTGITLGTLALYEELESLHCVEIVPGVVEGARFFSSENRNVLTDPRLDLSIGDGVQYLLTTHERFDIISSDSKLNPDYAGNAPLLSLDYYKLCRDRLTDNGIMVQWLAVHFPISEIKIITRSFTRAFPYVGVYWDNPNNIIMAGSKSPLVMEMDAARRYLSLPRISEDLANIQLDDIYLLATLYQCGEKTLHEKIGDGPINSWQHPIVEFDLTRKYLNKPRTYHEDDIFRWLRLLRDATSQRLTGRYDASVYERYLTSADKILEGFSLGGGIDQLQNGLSVFKAALVENPDDQRLKALIRRVEKSSNNIEEAYSKGLLNKPEGLNELGMLRREQGKEQEALELFERAFALQPNDPNIQHNRLLSLKNLGRKAAFHSALSKFREAFPRDPRGHSLWGVELASAGDFEQALEVFARAVELDPDSPVYQNNLATALARLERYEEAARAFARVCKLQPQHQNAAFFAAASFSMAGMPKEAAKWARFCIKDGLAQPERFATDPLFINLRNSEYWDASRAQPK